jgi:hypothetical protein
MVQLSVLLCLIPLALENAMMQAHITQVGGACIAALYANNCCVPYFAVGLVLCECYTTVTRSWHRQLHIQHMTSSVSYFERWCRLLCRSACRTSLLRWTGTRAR